MSSSFSAVPTNQVPCADEDLIYQRLFEEFIDYPSDDDTVDPIPKTVEKKHGNKNPGNDEVDYLSITSSSSKLDSKSGHDTAANNKFPDTVSGDAEANYNATMEAILAIWEDFVEWMTKRYPADADTEGQQKENTDSVGKGKAVATQTESDVQCSSEYEQNKETILSEQCPNVNITHAQPPVPQQSLYAPIVRDNVFAEERPFPINTIRNNSIVSQNKENEDKSNVRLTDAQRPLQSVHPPSSQNSVLVGNGSYLNNSTNDNSIIPQDKTNKYPNRQSPYVPIPQNETFVRGNPLPVNTININSINPAQTQTVESALISQQYVCDNGTGQSYHHPENEVRRPNVSHVNGTYYQNKFIQGSSKGNLHPSFLQHPIYTNEGKIPEAFQVPGDLSLTRLPKTPSTIIASQTLPHNSFNYMSSTWSKRPREDDDIEQSSLRPHKHHNGDQTQPLLPSTPLPSSFIHPMRAIIEEGSGTEDAGAEDDEDAEGEACGEDEYEYV